MGDIIAGIAGFFGTKEQVKGQERAAAASERGSQAAIDFLRESRDQTRGDNLYRQQIGDAALGKYAGLYGVAAPAGGGNAFAQAMSGGTGNALLTGYNGPAPTSRNALSPWSTYLARNPDVMAEAGRVVRTGEFSDPAAYGQWHYSQFGQREGRQLPTVDTTTGGPQINGGPGDGTNGMGGQGNALNTPNPYAPPGSDPRFGDFFASPDYQFRLSEGNRNLAASHAARGLLGSGAFAKAMQGYGQNTAAGAFGDYRNALGNLANIGQVANAANQQSGSVFAQGAANTSMQNAQNLMSSYGNRGNAWAGYYGQLGSMASNAFGGVNSGGGQGGSKGFDLAMLAKMFMGG